MSSSLKLAALGAAAPASLLLIAAPRAESAPQSTADALHAVFDTQGVGSDLGPIAPLAGPPTGKYDQTVTLPRVQDALALYPKNPTPTFFVNATGVTSHVSGSGVQLDFRNSEGDNAIATAQLSLNLNPPPPTANPVPYPPLEIDGREILSMASFSVTYPSPPVGTGSTRFGSLTITGTQIGGRVLRFSGSVPANTVAYSSPTVTIILNKQVKHGTISCNPTCTFTLTSLEVTAIDVTLHDFDDYGTKVSGHIQVNNDLAR